MDGKSLVIGGELFMENQEEIWAPISEDPRYDISNLGNVRSWVTHPFRKNDSPRPISCYKNVYGYITTRIGDRTKMVHRLIAQAFIPNPDNKPQVNHKDLNRSNNDVCNLEWVTATEIVRHAIDTGAFKNDHKYLVCGKNHYRSKSVFQYDMDWNFICEWDSCGIAGRGTGIDYRSIHRVCTGKKKSTKGFRFKFKQ